MSDPKVVLDEDDGRRTLVRIAHEIVEKNPDGRIALVGIHRRGAHLATRLHRLVSDLLDGELPAGDIDIAFYRDDLATREAPVVHSSHIPFRLEDNTIVLVDDVLYTGRTVRAAIEALFDYGRPAGGEVVAVEGDVDVAPRHVGVEQVAHEPVQARGEMGAAAMDAHQRDVSVSVLLDDLVRDAHERAADVVLVEDDDTLF